MKEKNMCKDKDEKVYILKIFYHLSLAGKLMTTNM